MEQRINVGELLDQVEQFVGIRTKVGELHEKIE
ncbi:hypothetical protein J2Z45_004193 [Cohnella lubricantis]|nr:hypothetical protein [Cohnella lubricantis]MBP2120573.1 hypothetical protein [Cohnella lubricantis]